MVTLGTLLQTLVATTRLVPAPESAPTKAFAEQDEERFLAYARHHRVTPLLAHHIQTGALTGIRQPIADACIKDLHRSRLRHIATLRALEAIEQAFAEAAIPYISLKGPRLANEAYPAVGLRSSDDLDLLIRRADVTKAEQTLQAQGYQPAPGSFPGWLVRHYHFHTQWWHPDTRLCVELHWQLADKQILPTIPHGNPFDDLATDPAAMPVYLSIHAAKHGVPGLHPSDPWLLLHPWSGVRLLWLWDIDALCRARSLHPDALHAMAKRWEVEHWWNWIAKCLSTLIQGTPTAHPRAETALMKRMAAEWSGEAKPLSPPPWWLRSGKRTGIRPIRLLNPFSRSKR